MSHLSMFIADSLGRTRGSGLGGATPPYAQLRPALIPALCSESASSLAVSTFSKGFNTIASSRRRDLPSQRRLVNTCTD